MALVISNTAAPGLAINFNGIGVALTVENVPGGAPPAAQIVSLTFGWETYFKHISCSGTWLPTRRAASLSMRLPPQVTRSAP